MTLENQVESAGKENLFNESTELGEAFKSMDNDSQDKKGRTAIDMNARISRDQASLIANFDEIKNMGILPRDADLARQVKRLSVSIDGQGRKEKVQIAQGVSEKNSGGGFLSRMFKPRE